MPMLGADISHWQSDNGNIVRQLKRQGVGFLIVKATQGDFTDAMFPTYLRQAKEAGMAVGAYHFLENPEYAGNTLPVQARTFVRAVERANGGNLDGVIMVLDDEAYAGNPQPYHARQFANEYYKITNKRPLFIYTTSSRFAHYDIPSFHGPVQLWLAWWTCNTNPPGVSCAFADGLKTKHRIPASFWQQKYNGKLPIIRQWTNGMRLKDGDQVDGNWTPYTRQELLRFASIAGDDGPFPPDEGPGTKPDPDADPWSEDWQEQAATVSGATTATTGPASLSGIGLAGGLALGAGVVAIAAVGLAMRGGSEDGE